MSERVIKLYIDCAAWQSPIQVDDFIISVGKTKSNSVYHVANVTAKPSPKHRRLIRYNLKCYKSNLLTACSRDNDQRLIPVKWYNRDKKQ